MGQRGREGRGIHMLSDEMHDGLFEHRGGQPPAGEVLLATVLDEAPGDVVAEPLPVFLFGVARRQPVPGLVEELACQPVAGRLVSASFENASRVRPCRSVRFFGQDGRSDIRVSLDAPPRSVPQPDRATPIIIRRPFSALRMRRRLSGNEASSDRVPAVGKLLGKLY